jgi:hypothetical protein
MKLSPPRVAQAGAGSGRSGPALGAPLDLREVTATDPYQAVEKIQWGGTDVVLGMPNRRIRRYLIDIKDATGQSIFFTAADWNDVERRAAIAQILRLEGVPESMPSANPN